MNHIAQPLAWSLALVCAGITAGCVNDDDGNPPPPGAAGSLTITTVAPVEGADSGGTAVTISGSGFVAGATVRFDAQASGSVTVNSSSQLVAVSPPGTAGPADIVVTNPGGGAVTATGGFLYTDGNPVTPALQQLSQTSGSAVGGTTITVTGNSFQNGATVAIGGNQATGVTVMTAGTIQAVTPAKSAGASPTVTVTVTNPGGNNSSIPGGYTYNVPAPAVSSVTPVSGPQSGGTTITITGTGFLGGATVTLGATLANSVTVLNSSTITCATPAAASAGAVSVTVTNTDAQSATLVNAFTYGVPPTVTSVSPASGPTTGGTVVTINGTNFQAGATATFGTASCTVTSVSATQVIVTSPAHASGLVNVTVTNPGGLSGTLTNGFTYP